MKMKTFVFEDPKPPPDFGSSKTDPKPPPDFGGSKIDVSVTEIPSLFSHGNIALELCSHLDIPTHRTKIIIISPGESFRIEVFKPPRTEDPCEETSRDTSLICSVPHTVLWKSSSLLPRNWADGVVESVYLQFLKQWSNWLSLESIQGLGSQAFTDRAGNRPEYKL